MKKSFLLAPAVLLLLSCGGNNDKRDDAGDASQGVEAGVHQLPRYTRKDSLKVGAHVFTYEILREASDSLPPAHDDQLGDTRDNIIRLRIGRDGQQLFQRTFTKAFFRSSMGDAFYKRSILDGISFRGADAARGLTFVFSVSEPDSDVSMPFAVTVSPDGAVSVQQETLDYVDEENESL